MKSRIAVVLSVLMIAGCTAGEKPSASTRVSTPFPHSDVSLMSANHEGHIYVIAVGTESVSILHSPACPCHMGQ